PRQHRPQIVDHLRLLCGRSEISTHRQGFFEVVKKTLQCRFRCRLDNWSGKGSVGLVFQTGLHPLIRHQQYRLGDIQRSKSRIDGKSHDLISQSDLVIIKTEALAPKKDTVVLTSLKTLPKDTSRFHRASHRLEAVTLAC